MSAPLGNFLKQKQVKLAERLFKTGPMFYPASPTCHEAHGELQIDFDRLIEAGVAEVIGDKIYIKDNIQLAKQR